MSMKTTKYLSLYVAALLILILSQDLSGEELGGRSAESIQSIFQEFATEIDKNYQEVLRKQPKLDLKVTFVIEIGKHGDVINCSWKKEEPSQEELNINVCNVIKKMNIGGGKHVAFNYTIHFFHK